MSNESENLDLTLISGVWFKSSVSGQLYRNHLAAGDIDCICVEGQWFESPEVIKELQTELNSVAGLTGEMQDIIDEQAAHIERLLRHWFSGRRGTDSWFLEGGGIFHEAPEQSLALHDVGVIRKMINDEDFDPSTGWVMNYANKLEKEN